jgi:stage V sporulation protein B
VIFLRKSIFTAALILTSASVITRVLGFVYRIYLSNAIGAEGGWGYTR